MVKGKGSSFERKICKRLSLWWTGDDRDDVFWRSQTSGGRATQRLKKGKTTYGSYGDIAAVDPRGEPLLKIWTIELKRGRRHGCIADILECKDNGVQCSFEKAIMQAERSATQAGSVGWMLISRPDHRLELVYMDWASASLFKECLYTPYVRYDLWIQTDTKGNKQAMRIVCMSLENLLSRLRPDRVVDEAQ